MTLGDYLHKLSAREDLFDREIVVEHLPANVPADSLTVTDIDPAGPVWIEPVG